MSIFTHYSGRYESSKPPHKKAAGLLVFFAVLLIVGIPVGLYYLFPQILPVFAQETIPLETALEASVTIPTEPTQTIPPATQPPETVPPTPSYTPLSPAMQVIYPFAKEHGIRTDEYPKELIAMMLYNPDTQDFVLHYPLEHDQVFEVNLWDHAGSETVPLFMQWDRRWGYLDYGGEMAAISACGPVCLSMVVCYLTGDYSNSPDVMMRYAIDNGYCVPGEGTYWSFMNRGGAAFGLDVQEFSANKNRILSNLEAGNPIICIMGPGDFTRGGHFIVLTGVEDGLIRVNDPNSYTNSKKLWEYDDIHDQIRNAWVFRTAG